MTQNEKWEQAFRETMALEHNDLNLEEAGSFSWSACRTDLSEWIRDDRVRLRLIQALKKFLWYFQDKSVFWYRRKIKKIAQDNTQSLELDFMHLCRSHEAVLGQWLADAPEEMLSALNEVASWTLKLMFPLYAALNPAVYVRITGLTIKDTIRDLRSMQLRSLVHVDGVIIRRSQVFKQLLRAQFECGVCGGGIGPLIQSGPKEVRPLACPRCQSKGPFRLNTVHCAYRNHQLMALQESPGSVAPGRLPRTLELCVTEDLVDCAKPGDNVNVVGIFKHSYDPVLHHKQGFPIFLTHLEVNNLTPWNTAFNLELQDHEQRQFHTLAHHPLIRDKFVRSVAPSIHGHGDVKLGLLLSLLGGVSKERAGHRIRGDLNVLLLGDPGTGKSQFLKWVARVSHRAVFTTGKGSSAVGLTAAVHRDVVSGEYVLEGGAMVLADRGVCLIDEFDKMNDHDRTSIHEAMEQQTISVARAGIVTSLSARCTVIAAANPVTGSYDGNASLNENIQLTKTILSRFDLIFIMCDEPGAETDLMLGKFVTYSHQQNHPHAAHEVSQPPTQERMEFSVSPMRPERTLKHEEDVLQGEKAVQKQDKPSISHFKKPCMKEDEDPNTALPFHQDWLKKYIYYARTHCHPRIKYVNPHRIPHLFAELRQVSAITIRELESIIRLAEAHARLHLRDFVEEEDFMEAIGLFLRCFLRRQKHGEHNHLFARFRKYMVHSEKRYEALVETCLRDLIHHELSGEVSSVEDEDPECGSHPEPRVRTAKSFQGNTQHRVMIPLQRLAEAVSNDGITASTLRNILSRGKLLDSCATLVDNMIVCML